MDLGKLFALALVLSSCSLHYAGCQLEPPLFLTPLIKSGLISEAQNSARVHNFLPGSISYSGFITVNEEYNSNLFFWYFPATSVSPSSRTKQDKASFYYANNDCPSRQTRPPLPSSSGAKEAQESRSSTPSSPKTGPSNRTLRTLPS